MISRSMTKKGARTAGQPGFVNPSYHLQARFPFAPAFLQTIKTYFGGGFREVDYIDAANREKTRQAINAWAIFPAGS
jgi:serine protease inhibitor